MSRSPSSGAGLGIVAAVAMVTCCALPALVSAGALAVIGGALRSPLVIAAAVLVLAGAVAYALRRHHHGAACSVPEAESSAASERDRA